MTENNIIITKYAAESYEKLDPNKEKIGLIYGHYLETTDKWYIGKTIFIENPNKRWNFGKKYFNKTETKFSKAITENSWTSFQHIILEYTYDSLLNECERKWISEKDSYKNGYNSTEGGEITVGNAMRDKISLNRKGKCTGSNNHNYGKKFSEEIKNKLSESHRGKTHSDITKKKMSISHMGHSVSEKTINHIKNLNKGKHTKQLFGEENPASKKVYVIDEKNQILKKYNSITDCINYLNISKTTIQKLIKFENTFYEKKFNMIVYLSLKSQHYKEENHSLVNINFKKSKKKKIILKLDMNNNIIKEYKSSKDICIDNNISSTSHIFQCCNKKRNSAYGFKWSYKEE